MRADHQKKRGDMRKDTYDYQKDKKIYSVVVIGACVLMYMATFMVRPEMSPSAKPYDAIVVLGGGKQSPEGKLPVGTALRAEEAFKFWSELPAGKRPVFITISGGTTHTPNYEDSDGFPVWESTATADYLIKLGVPASQIYKEWASYDTVGNAYFTRTTITDIRDWRRLVIVTNDWHMERTKAMFNKVFSLEGNANIGRYQLTYLTAVDTLGDKEIIKSRLLREEKNKISFIKNTEHIRDLAQFHEWMYQTHVCYAVHRQNEPRESSKDNTVAALYSA